MHEPGAVASDVHEAVMRRLFVVVTALCVIVVAVAAFQGPPVFDAPRWPSATRVVQRTAVPFVSESASHTPTPIQTAGSSTPLVLDARWFFLAIVIVAVLIVVAVTTVTVVRRAKQRETLPLQTADEPVLIDAPRPEDDADVPAGVVRRGLDAARDHLAGEGTSADAIVAAWRGLEEAAEDSGIVRRASQTPTEFTASLLSRVAGADDDVRLLLGLYLAVRYGGHAADEQAIATARSAIADLRERWNA